MTVISTAITQHCTAHASDSFLMTLKSDGSRDVVEDRASKLVRVKHFRGAMAFWGLAKYGQWSTLEWLNRRAQAAGQYASPEDFANRLGSELDQELRQLPFANDTDKGIGIHFSCYERMNDYWIPELFLISNWSGIPYTAVRPTGIGVSRETFHVLTQVDPAPEHRELRFRMRVLEAIHSGILFRYDNGDPVLFNSVADAMMDTFFEFMRRGVLNDPSREKTHCALVRRPIEVISHLFQRTAKMA